MENLKSFSSYLSFRKSAIIKDKLLYSKAIDNELNIERKRLLFHIYNSICIEVEVYDSLLNRINKIIEKNEKVTG